MKIRIAKCYEDLGEKHASPLSKCNLYVAFVFSYQNDNIT